MEISDLDDRFHRAPEGWELARVDYNVINSSQIFRYVRVAAKVKRTVYLMGPSTAMAATAMTGVGIGARPIIRALLESKGIIL